MLDLELDDPYVDEEEFNTKVVTGRDILNAIEENGFTHYYSGWTDVDPEESSEPITAACVMGQAAINLGVDMYDLESKLEKFRVIVDSNTQKAIHMPYPDIGLASYMIRHNDTLTSSGNRRSYSDLKKIARRRFEPFLDKTVEVRTATYNAKKKSEL